MITQHLARTARVAQEMTRSVAGIGEQVDEAVQAAVALGASAHDIAVSLGLTLPVAEDVAAGRLSFATVLAQRAAQATPSFSASDETDGRRARFARAQRDGSSRP